MNLPKLTILTAETDAACDPETGTCTIPQTPVPSPGPAPATGAVLPGMEETPSAQTKDRLVSASQRQARVELLSWLTCAGQLGAG